MVSRADLTALRPAPLTAAAFAPFGSLVDAATGPGLRVNEGRGLRRNVAFDLPHDTASPEPRLAFYDIEASAFPVWVAVLERHVRSAQLFLHLDGGAFLVVVAPTDGLGRPDLGELVAFTGAPGQGIVYRPGVWHLPLVALDTPARFAMLMWETGTREDCEVRNLERPVVVDASPLRPRLSHLTVPDPQT